MSQQLKLAVKATEDPETVIWAVLGPDDQPRVIGTFPRLPGPPVVTIRALSEMLADLMGLSLTTEPERARQGAYPSRFHPEAN